VAENGGYMGKEAFSMRSFIMAWPFMPVFFKVRRHRAAPPLHRALQAALNLR
jgi:hypothetical protein